MAGTRIGFIAFAGSVYSALQQKYRSYSFAMNRKVAWSLLAALGLILVDVEWRSSVSVQGAAVPKQSASVKIPQRKKDPIVVPTDFDWGALSGADLAGLADHFGNSKSPNTFRVERVVRLGETLVMDVYEGRPGEFVCTKITPTIKTLEDGKAGVEFKVDCISVSLTGGQRTLFAKFSDTHFVADRCQKSIVEMTLEGQHVIGLFAKNITAKNPSARIHVSGSYKEYSRPLNKVSIDAFGLEGSDQ